MEVAENPLSKLTAEQIQGMLGALREEGVESTPPTQIFTADPPTNFDSRQQWPNWIHPIRDQQSCGSCWAFGAAEAFSDRFFIASQGAINVVLSP